MGESGRFDQIQNKQPNDGMPALDQVRHHANILFLVDLSGSMAGRKMEKAIEAVEKTVDSIPADVKYGLRVFGEAEPEMKDCHNSRLLVPLGRNKIKQVYDALGQIDCNGPYSTGNYRTSRDDQPKTIQLGPSTPTAFGLKEAWDKDFAGVEGSRGVILITDGAWTCNVDPCDEVKKINRDGNHLRVDIVSLDGADDNKLICITESSGGKLIHEDDLDNLEHDLGDVVDQSLHGQVLDGKQTSSPTKETHAGDKADCHCHSKDKVKASANNSPLTPGDE